MAIRDLLDRDTTLTPSEQKIAQILLCDYPVSGLGTQSGLARRAGVSDPTVVRFVTKLGFDGFTEFQASLLDEVEARLRSPLMMIEAKRRPDNRSVAQTYLASVADRIVDAESATMAQSYDRAINLIMAPKAQILVAGGRFSRHVAGMLGAYLSQLRPGVTALGPLSTESFDALLDLGCRDVLIVFDYRRYQTDTVALATQAAARGVRIVLFTDPWMSPIAELAEVVLVTPVEVDSPYDSLAPAVAQMEALVAEAVTLHGAEMHPRVADLEVLRSSAGATLDGSTPQPKAAETRK
jgi:DNA-binding MurR/RpiR family transcriptional regulator